MFGPVSPALTVDFLREANPDHPLERPCVNGEDACMAVITTSKHVDFETGGIVNAAPDKSFVMREFYLPDVWFHIQKEGRPPAERTSCYVCKKYMAAMNVICAHSPALAMPREILME